MAVNSLIDRLTEQARGALDGLVPDDEDVLFEVSMDDFPVTCEHGEKGVTAGVAFWLSVPVKDDGEMWVRAQTAWTVRAQVAMDPEWFVEQVRGAYRELVFERVSFHEETAPADGEEPGPAE